MSDGSPFLVLGQSCDDAIGVIMQQMRAAGLLVMPTFDLHAARHTHTSCACPNHGTADCDCQMVVLLVYANGGAAFSKRQPVSLVAHGYNGQTSVSVVDSPQQRADPLLKAAIRQALIPILWQQ